MEHNRPVHSLKLLVKGMNIGTHPMNITLHLQYRMTNLVSFKLHETKNSVRKHGQTDK
jgi:hypothetical protein